MAFDPDAYALIGLTGRLPPETFLRERTSDGKQDLVVRGKALGAFSWAEAFQGRVSVDTTPGSESMTIAPGTP